MKYIIIIIILLILIVGVGALALLGKSFISEVILEPALVEPLATNSDVSLEKPAPYFELLDLNGDKIKLPDLLGTPVILIFWTTWNYASADQIKIIDDYLSKDSMGLFDVIAISSQEDRSVVDNFISRGGYEIKVLLDESGEITEAYRAHNLPISFFINKEGIIKNTFMGVLSGAILKEKTESLFK